MFPRANAENLNSNLVIMYIMYKALNLNPECACLFVAVLHLYAFGQMLYESAVQYRSSIPPRYCSGDKLHVGARRSNMLQGLRITLQSNLNPTELDQRIDGFLTFLHVSSC